MLTPGKFYSLVITVFLIIFLVERNPSLKITSYASCQCLGGICDCLGGLCDCLCCRPTPTPTSEIQPTPTRTPAPTEVIPTNTPIPETPTPTQLIPTNTPPPEQPSATPTNTPSQAGPTNTPGPRPEHNTCYYQCDSDYDCHLGQECQDVGSGRKICRNPYCPEETDCECAGPTATPEPAGGMVLGESVTPTPIAKYGEVLGLAYTGSDQTLALHLPGVA